MPTIVEHLRRFNRRDAHPVLQFVKYGIAGGLATGVHMTVFFLCAWKLFPALTPADPFVRLFAAIGVAIPTPELTDATRAAHVMLDNVVAFLFSNAVAYVINVAWVFRSGRHGRKTEILLFLAASGLSTAIGTALAGALVRWMGVATTYAFAANVLVSVLINYTARKFFIFQG